MLNFKSRVLSFRTVLFLVVLAALSACSKPQSYSSVSAEVASRNFTPQNAEVASIYNRSCRSCHTVAATGAPLTGDAAAWAPRMEKGMTILVDNVVNGFGGMPPFGLCMDCDVDQFEALIVFMAEAK